MQLAVRGNENEPPEEEVTGGKRKRGSPPITPHRRTQIGGAGTARGAGERCEEFGDKMVDGVGGVDGSGTGTEIDVLVTEAENLAAMPPHLHAHQASRGL